jgi:tRNA A-37 threonylcarbamoyl transferase component Bud32
MQFIKNSVERHEYELAHLSRKFLNIKTPSIISYDGKNKIMISEKIWSLNVADYYGDGDDKTPDNVYDKIRDIIRQLLNADIVYPDITGYNFIEDKNGEIWIVDFGHAYVKSPNAKVDSFVLKFLDGYNGWNPEFR